ncbi:MAG TPA: hypothetical protein VGF29_00820 [Hyphomicrobiaceae bacterium]|jgi:hypothetical protein
MTLQDRLYRLRCYLAEVGAGSTIARGRTLGLAWPRIIIRILVDAIVVKRLRHVRADHIERVPDTGRIPLGR